MTAQLIVTSPAGDCSDACMWRSPGFRACATSSKPDTAEHIHVPDPGTFAGLRNVTTGQLDAAMNTFTSDDWDHLAQGFLDQIGLDVLEYLDALDFDFNPGTDYSLDIFVRILHRYEQTLLKRQQTTGGIR